MTAETVIGCMVCGRRLTDPDSVKRGVGPVCWRRLKRTQRLDYFVAVSPDASGYAVDEESVAINFKWRGSLLLCPRCGKPSPNPNSCPSCSSPIKARPLEEAE